LTTYVCESQMKRKMIKEAQDAGEAGEKKQGRKACFPFQVVRPSPRATWKTRRVWSLRTWYISPNHSCRIRLTMVRCKCHEAMSIR
jgi:hypothetical protein